ncbi:MAG: alpha/beta fold hydrolase, partial [Acidimicrobiales bacterium]
GFEGFIEGPVGRQQGVEVVHGGRRLPARCQDGSVAPAPEPARVPSSDDVTLVVHDLAPSTEGRFALLAHATGFHGRVWLPIARRLTGLRPWAPDLRGHGDSGTPADHDFEWESFADDVLAVLDALSPGATAAKGTVGVGHSKGGAALLLAEARRPGTFAALWVYEPVVFPEAATAPAAVVAEGSRGNQLAAGPARVATGSPPSPRPRRTSRANRRCSTSIPRPCTSTSTTGS